MPVLCNVYILKKDILLRAGGGGGFTPSFFVKIDFKIAVEQQTRARDRTFEGFPDSGCHRCLRDSHTHIWSIFGLVLPKHLNMLKTMLWGALLVATSLLNTCIKVLSKLDKNWLSYEQNTICPYLGMRTKYDRFWPINWVNINIFE